MIHWDFLLDLADVHIGCPDVLQVEEEDDAAEAVQVAEDGRMMEE